jgi:hypothetical protein
VSTMRIPAPRLMEKNRELCGQDSDRSAKTGSTCEVLGTKGSKSTARVGCGTSRDTTKGVPKGYPAWVWWIATTRSACSCSLSQALGTPQWLAEIPRGPDRPRDTTGTLSKRTQRGEGRLAMYSYRALARRRCTGTRRDGRPCRAYACWGDVKQRCGAHGGKRQLALGTDRHPNCACPAYPWPHRPASGLCNWPDEPNETCATKQGTRSAAGKQWKRDKKLARRFGIDPDYLRRDLYLSALLEFWAVLSRWR